MSRIGIDALRSVVEKQQQGIRLHYCHSPQKFGAQCGNEMIMPWDTKCTVDVHEIKCHHHHLSEATKDQMRRNQWRGGEICSRRTRVQRFWWNKRKPPSCERVKLRRLRRTNANLYTRMRTNANHLRNGWQMDAKLCTRTWNAELPNGVCPRCGRVGFLKAP